MQKQTTPVAIVEDTPADLIATLATLRTMRRDLKQTVLDPLASWLALPGILRTTQRYFRDVIPVPFDLASIGLTTCVGTDDDGMWLIQIRGEIAHHGVRISQVGPSLAFTLHQCAERAYERLDRLIAEAERDSRRACAGTRRETVATRAALLPVSLLAFLRVLPQPVHHRKRVPPMTNPTTPRPYCFTHATGRLPAWIWQALSNAQHDARHNGLPIVVAHDGLRRFMIVDIDDWGDLFTPSPETPPDRDYHATCIQHACQSGRKACDTLAAPSGSP